MIICKRRKTPYNTNKSIIRLFVYLAYYWRYLYNRQYRYYVRVWCTLVYFAFVIGLIDIYSHVKYFSKLQK
nr:MAG TPA: hypothetical protein [Caudoviricetes sp.]